jgi:hypothetical protein
MFFFKKETKGVSFSLKGDYYNDAIKNSFYQFAEKIISQTSKPIAILTMNKIPYELRDDGFSTRMKIVKFLRDKYAVDVAKARDLIDGKGKLEIYSEEQKRDILNLLMGTDVNYMITYARNEQ